MKPKRVDYCQFLLSTQINYTQTYHADHHPHFSHDAINRYLQADKVTPVLAWKAIKSTIHYSNHSALLDTQEFWVIDWRIYNPDEDGKTKLDHMREMFDNALHHKKLPFDLVLMDAWYATKELMVHIDKAGKTFYCPLKSNRKVDDSGGENPYQAVSELVWSEAELAGGKVIKIHGFPGAKKVKLFRVVAGNGRTEWVVTNDLTQASTDATHALCAVR